ncbi:TetR/AcrR family transcriptional regulator (plasmid) [Rhizobium sp. K1/93]|nr:TetR/AcrR family transcriptional regulator [Rhizobium sp. L58/93]MBO9172131.1 TetR/AcrR family transcriptional regulator [Rhizobium sp. L245/93]QXZ88356.1 TetR/AcrR family transcriptional regulator [Rhizobium sp. K1/93]QXZ94387.1 TetR/AcrR family transcriptional regulator [Rhizobium sp. K15/93]QYA05812.1 TetR/AcrR family transcriptional regulator [Rhizobium sp. B21/90]
MSGRRKLKQEKTTVPAPGRWPAGEDPIKRKKILDGADQVFMRLGFDAASMDDVRRQAGVSKGTLYVYFDNKEELFSATIERQRATFIATMRMTLAEHGDLEGGLYDFGVTFVRHITDETVITALRTVLGVRDRMPSLCTRIFKGPENLRSVLQDFLLRHSKEGDLEIDDLELAAGQYLDLCSGSFFKLRLFGTMNAPPEDVEIERVIRGAVKTFLAAYGSKPT